MNKCNLKKEKFNRYKAKVREESRERKRREGEKVKIYNTIITKLKGLISLSYVQYRVYQSHFDLK